MSEKKVQHKEEFLEKVQLQASRSEDFNGDIEDNTDDDTDDDSDMSISKKRASIGFDKFDMLVGKLEKLDKLDELLRKLDSMKLVAGGGGGGPGVVSSGRGYVEIKAELEDLQKIIFDETNKYSDKEKEDANIKYEKASQELAQTDEYKREVAAALEEKTKEK